MINEIKLKNFRSHPDTTLEFHPGVNVIVGNPNSGKTNIVRAIQWVSDNRPTGDRIKNRYSDDDTEVVIKIDGVPVSLQKGKDTVYKTPEEEFRTFGSSVPDSVKKIINLTSINIQEQLDQHYLIASAPGEVARELNSITKLEESDIWKSELTSEINSTNRKISMLKADETSLTTKLEEFSDLIGFEEKLNKVQNLFFEAEKIEEDITNLESIVNTLYLLNEKLDRYEIIIKTLTPVKKIEELFVKRKTIEDQIKKILGYIENEEKLTRIRIFTPFLEIVKEIEKKYISYTSLKSEISKLGYLIKGLEEKSDSSLCGERKLRELKDKIKEIWESLEICPFCHSKIDKISLKHILKEEGL